MSVHHRQDPLPNKEGSVLSAPPRRPNRHKKIAYAFESNGRSPMASKKTTISAASPSPLVQRMCQKFETQNSPPSSHNRPQVSHFTPSPPRKEYLVNGNPYSVVHKKKNVNSSPPKPKALSKAGQPLSSTTSNVPERAQPPVKHAQTSPEEIYDWKKTLKPGPRTDQLSVAEKTKLYESTCTGTTVPDHRQGNVFGNCSSSGVNNGTVDHYGHRPKSSPAPRPPPVKPPRTFAHDIYMKSKLRPNSLYGQYALPSGPETRCQNVSKKSNSQTPPRNVQLKQSSPTSPSHFSSSNTSVPLHRETQKSNAFQNSSHPQNTTGVPQTNSENQRSLTLSSHSTGSKTAADKSQDTSPQKDTTKGKISPYAVSQVNKSKLSFLPSLSCVSKQPYYQPSELRQKHFVDITQATVSRPKDYSKLRRSYSDDHIYAEPEMDEGQDQQGNKRQKDNYNGLHYMCSPIAGVSDDFDRHGPRRTPATNMRGRKLFTTQIKDVINQSFNSVKRHLQGPMSKSSPEENVEMQGDSSSEVSFKDVQERIIYVRSLKKQVCSSNQGSGSAFTKRMFESVYIIGYKCTGAQCPQPEVNYKFPRQGQSFKHDPVVIAHLSLPEDFKKCNLESFQKCVYSFTLTNESGERTFWHCLRVVGEISVLSSTVRTPAILCLMTKICAPAFYIKLLHELESYLSLPEESWTELIESLSAASVPAPGGKVNHPLKLRGSSNLNVSVPRPLDDKFSEVKFTLLLSLLDADIILKIVSSLLLERRIIFLASDYCTLYQAIAASEALLYPFKWLHTKIPVVPKCLLAQCSTSDPYLLGVQSAQAQTVLEIMSNQVLVVDLDQGALLSEVEDEKTILPNKMQKAIRTALSLAKNMTDPTESMRDVMIAESFVRMFVELVGHCDQHITLQSNGEFTFQKEQFIKSPSSRGIQMFLQWFTETQMFDLFLFERGGRLRQLQQTPQHHLLPKGLFERRANEHLQDIEHSSGGLREIGKKVKIFGEKLRQFKGF